jgi:hypothetical protein
MTKVNDYVPAIKAGATYEDPKMTLQTFADNTAALAGGLVAGDVYKTAAGEVRITV